MDVDFWAARVHSSKHTHVVHSHNNSGNYRMVMGDQGEDEVRAWFPCPFCYVEIELPVLCVHLQEEHCFDLRNAVCPICAANLGRDALAHFTLQHAHSVKRRKKSQKSGLWSNASTNMVRDFRELRSFAGSNSLSEPAHDPLLSPFLCTVPLGDSKENVQEDLLTSNVDSNIPSVLDEVEEKYNEERRQQAAFLQEILVSTIFFDS